MFDNKLQKHFYKHSLDCFAGIEIIKQMAVY